MKNIITDDNQCPIKPENIVAESTRNFMGSVWQNMETELSVYWLVKFAQDRGSWTSFTMKELLSFYQESFPGKGFWYGRLIDDGYIQVLDDSLSFTIEFVAACYAVSPVLEKD